MKKILGALFLFLISCGTIAGATFPFSEKGWDSSEKKIVDDGYLTLSEVTIGVTTFDQIVGIFGKSTLYKPDKKNYSPNLLCYKSVNDDTTVVFQSGPLGGWKIITAVWIGKASFVDTSKCAESKLVDRERMQVNGLSLDLNIDDVKKYLGDPTFHNQSFYAYRYEDQTSTEKNKIFDVTSGFEFEFGQHEINWFRVYKQLSN